MSESKIYTIPDGNNSLDPNLMLALSQNGGFGNNGNWMWMMFMWILFPWIFGGNGNFGGFGNGAGTGFLANQLNNDAGRDLLLQAINGRITIVYETTCDDIDFIIKTLREISCPKYYINKALDNLEECKLNSGLTYSNIALKSSVIIINKTSSFSQLINTISHEYYHLIQHLSGALNIEDEEELANLNGNLNMRSYNIVEKLKER